MSDQEPLSDFDRRLRLCLMETIHNGNSSVQALANAVGRSSKHIYSALHPYPESAGDGGRAVPNLHWLAPLIDITGDVTPLQMIAERVGYTLVAMAGGASTEDVQADYISAMAEVGDIARDIQSALDKGGPGGGQITDAEWEKIEKDRMEAMIKLAGIRRPGK